MRTRNRTLTTTVPAGQYRKDDLNNPGDINFPYILETGPQTDWTLTETMTDELSGMRKYGSVTHDKIDVRYFCCDITYDYWYLDTPYPNPIPGQGPRPLYRLKWSGAGLWRMYLGSSPGNTWGSPTIAVPSTYDWSNFSYNAVQIMKPSLNKSGLLILNAISELKDVCVRKHTRAQSRREYLDRKSIKDMERSERSRKRHQANVAKTRLRGRSLSQVTMGALRGFSRFNLLYQFAIMPTISDVKEVLDRINNLEKNIQAFIREGNNVQTRHFTCPILDRITLPADIVRANVAYSAVHPGYGVREETRWDTMPRYHATMRFSYDVSKLQGLLGTLRSRLDAFGIDRLLSSLWEAIPFSFVVDWFINVGDVLESLESQITDFLPIRILDFVHSIKYKYTTRLIHNQGQLGTSHLKISGILLYEKSVTRYIRRAEAPSLWARLSVRLPSLNQLLLGGSLFGSRIKRNKPLE